MDFEIEPGQVVGILGPNGAGKTTTIRMMTGAIPPSRGSISVDGLDSISQTIGVRRRIGYLPESAPAYREMRTLEFLRFRAGLFGLRGRRRGAAIEKAIGLCQLEEVRKRRVGQLSKGYRQRVGLASVLLHDPKVLILDEPTNGLDPAQIASARSLIRHLAGERTMIVVSHILPEVEKSCDRIILFAGGKVRADGPPESLITALPGAGRYTVEAKQDSPDGRSAEEVLRTVRGVRSIESSDAGDGWVRCLLGFEVEDDDHREGIARHAQAAGLTVRELRAQTPTLEDVYLRLVAYADDHDAQKRAEQTRRQQDDAA